MSEARSESVPSRTRGVLDLIEWIGNALPDPAALFLIGAVLTVVISHLVAPPIPDGFEMRWTDVGNLTGGPDEHLATLVEKRTGRLVSYKSVAQADGALAAHMVFSDTGEAVLDGEGRPIDVSEHGWVVFQKRPVEDGVDATGKPVLRLEPTGAVEVPRSLMTSNGLYWCLKSLEPNFLNFAPLGVVLVGMLGIGVAERTGLIAALLKTFMLVVPRRLLTPTMVFLGIMSSVGSDAGYVVLPPLAAAIYLAAGRSPLVGIAAVFSGVSAGFNANLLITTLEPIMSNLTAQGAQVIDATRQVAPTAGWYFMAASTFVITGAGWLTTALFVERRFDRKPAGDGGPDASKAEPPGPSPWTGAVLGWWAAAVVGLAAGVTMLVLGLSMQRVMAEQFGLARAGLVVTALAGAVALPGAVYRLARVGLEAREAFGVLCSMVGLVVLPVVVLALVLAPTLFPGVVSTPLSGKDGVFDRWVAVVVPIIFLTFLLPGVVHGVVMGSLRGSKDVARLMIESMAGMAPIIVLAFFAGQFVSYFGESNLGRMLAFTGGEWLFNQRMSPAVLVVAFIGVTMFFNLFIGSMSAKYALFAPIFVPMFMLIGIRPELTMTAYRIGDSVTNVITPLNAYLVIVLVFMQRFAPKSGMGTLIAMMLPYTVVFSIVWTIFLLIWMSLGWPLGVGDPVEVFSPEYAGQ